MFIICQNTREMKLKISSFSFSKINLNFKYLMFLFLNYNIKDLMCGESFHMNLSSKSISCYMAIQVIKN
jgi:hypothetical protein